MENNQISPNQKAYNIKFAAWEMVRFKVEVLAAHRLSKELSLYLVNEILKETENQKYWNDVKESLELIKT
jgi:hypothetical protein